MDISPNKKLKQKTSIETLSKEEVINKYKGLLTIAKHAKHAKDELYKENVRLRLLLTQNEENRNDHSTVTMNNFSDNIMDNSTSSEIISSLHIENESLKRQLRCLTEENETLLKDMDEMAVQLQKVGTEQKKYLEQLEYEVIKLKDMERKNDRLQNELTNLFEEHKDLQKELNSKCEYINKLEDKYKYVKEVNSDQRQKFNNLKDKFLDVYRKLKNLKKCKQILLDTQYEYAHSVSNWQIDIIKVSNVMVEQLNATKMEKEILLNKFNALSQMTNKSVNNHLKLVNISLKVMQLQKLSEEVFDQRTNDKYIITGLQDENQLLKLSAEYCKELPQNIKTIEKSNLVKLQKSYNELQLVFQTKVREHEELLNKITELNKTLKNQEDVITQQNEKHKSTVANLYIMSEQFKLFERKLNKNEELIKIKDEEIANITKEVIVALEKVQYLQTICNKKNEHLQEINQDLTSLSYPDQNSESFSTISLEEEFHCSKDEEESIEVKYFKLKGLTAKLKSELINQSDNIAELNALKQENKKIKVEINDLENHLIQIQNECTAKANQLDVLKLENQNLISNKKHANVLNLEIEAVEKSLIDVTAKLNSKTSEVDRLKKELASKENTNVQLRKEISLLEISKNAEYTHSLELKTHISQLQEQLKEVLYIKKNANTLIKEFERKSVKHEQEKEELYLRLSELESKYEKSINQARIERDELNFNMNISKKELQNAQEHLEASENSMKVLRNEFNDYKLKAQAVLRKNQNKDKTIERDVQEQLMSLRTSELHIQTQLTTTLKKLEETEQNNIKLSSDIKSIEYNNQELLNTIKILHIQNENISQELEKKINLHQETLQNHYIQLNNLKKYYEIERATQENKHRIEMEKLRNEYVESNSHIIEESIGPSINLFHGKSKIDNFLLEREDAEGSEEVNDVLQTVLKKRKLSNDSHRSHHDVMPLDELLNTPMTNISDVITLTQTDKLVSSKYKFEESDSEYLYLELQTVKVELQKQESQVRHLTILLAENEQDLAKLNQMNHTLKEELRRQERGIERDKHMNNSEYLKNVILKFLTLGNSDERTRLVPVLNTILKLSPSEMDVLNCVAKGLKVSQENSYRGWSSFLSW